MTDPLCAVCAEGLDCRRLLRELRAQPLLPVFSGPEPCKRHNKKEDYPSGTARGFLRVLTVSAWRLQTDPGEYA